MPLQPGTTLLNGSLRIERLIGKGTYGEVYLADNAGAPRAVKIVRKRDPGVGSSFFELYLRRFTQEAQLGMRLLSRGATRVVQTYGLFKDSETDASELLLLMEYMPGGTLADKLERAPEGLPLADVLRIAQDVATGLKELHAIQAIHRDLKPANLLFDAGGLAKIADLGLAKLPRSGMSSLGAGDVSVIGTDDYMAPEQWQGQVKRSSDVYAFGCIVFEALTGQVYAPLRAGTRAGSLRAETPDWLGALVAKCLAREADERYADGAELAAAISAAIEAAQTAAATGEADAAAERARAEGEAQARAAEERAALARKTAADAAEKARQARAAEEAAAAEHARRQREAAERAERERQEQARQEAAARDREARVANARKAAADGIASRRWADARTAIQTLRALGIDDADMTRMSREIDAGQTADIAERNAKTRRALLVGGGGAGVLGLGALLLRGGGGSPAPAPTPTLQPPAIATSGSTLTRIPQTGSPTASSTATATVPPTSTVTPAATVTRAPTATASLAKVRKISANLVAITVATGIEIQFVRIAGGDFLMGSDRTRDPVANDDELPQHKLTLPEYWMGKTPVLVTQYSVFVTATKRKTNQSNAQHAASPAMARFPVTNVTWEDAIAFCDWATITAELEINLASEAEWEKAARGTDGGIYPWGNDAPDATRLDTTSRTTNSPVEVGKYPRGASAAGCDDMVGNVTEWTRSLYGRSFTPSDYPYPYSNRMTEREDVNAASDILRVLRGGSFANFDPKLVRCAIRNKRSPLGQYDNVGFRVIARLPGL